MKIEKSHSIEFQQEEKKKKLKAIQNDSLIHTRDERRTKNVGKRLENIKDYST